MVLMMKTAVSPDRRHIPRACGVYLMRDASRSILYIGKANDLSKRVAQYFRNRPDPKNSALAPLVRSIDYIPCASEREALLLERRLIHAHQPFFNSMWKDGKTYPYIKITLNEDFPRLLLTRRKTADGGAYFGPYPKVTPIRGLLDYLWRQKFFPLRPCRWEFNTDKPLDPGKIRSCLYYHTKECPAPCAGRITPNDYGKIAEDAVSFFKGQYGKLRERFKQEMKAASGRLEFERAAVLRDNIEALSQMGERVRVRRIAAEDAAGPLLESRAVTDLQQALALERPPAHVECFDISHFAGKQTVASMVCFQGGTPNKDHYRRFKIKATPGIDDFACMKETVGRRYRRLAAEGVPLPDLVVVDGGKGQLSSGEAGLADAGVKIPIIALAKRREEIFLPGREPVLLERDRPALRLLQRLRDEAHRFAISYHRLLRGKELFS